MLARFVPIVRTYIPVAAGVGHMPYSHFLRFNAIGAFLWGVCVTVLGYFLGQLTFVKDNIEVILIGIVGLSLIPVAFEIWRARRHSARDERYDEDSERDAVTDRVAGRRSTTTGEQP